MPADNRRFRTGTMIERIPHSGAYQASWTTPNNHLRTETFYGYTKREVVSLVAAMKREERNA